MTPSPDLTRSEWIVLKRTLARELLRLHARGKRIAAGRSKGIRPSEHAMEAAEVQMLYDKIKTYTDTL